MGAERRTRLLWHSNCPWAPTGYGNQTGLFAPELADHYDMAISSFYGLDGAPLTWNGVKVYPGLAQDFGNEFLLGHANSHFDGDLRGGVVFTLFDVWVLNPAIAARLDMACWTPVDHQPVPPRVRDFFARSSAIPVAMSRFGQEQLSEAGLDPLYVPHGIDVNAYRPHNRNDSRRALGLPRDAFIVGMVAANKGRNPSRKGFQQALEAFARLLERHNDAVLYLHTNLNPNYAEGENLLGMVEALKLPLEAIKAPEQYRLMFDPYSPGVMAKLFSTFDVLLHPSMGEGFGIPIVEAQACGVPVITTDFSAMPELTGAGWSVEWQPFWTGQQSYQAMASVDDTVEALEHAYRMSGAERKELGRKAREFAKQYAVPRVLREHLLPALSEVEARLGARRPSEVVERVAA